jgi:tRNA(Ile)-lysidine synthase
MRSSHPPTLLRVAERTIAEERLFGKGDCVLVAVSGGPDSMALLHVLARLAPRFGARVAAHGVDHGLRASAAAELALAERLAERLGVFFTSTRLEVAPGPNLMARAREARHGALSAALNAFLGEGVEAERGRIATAHHADDRAETLLMRLLRGTGPAGLAVLPARDSKLIRPFIRARRQDILVHLGRHDIAYAEDPTNRDPRFLRTRVRSELLPQLAELSPRIVGHLSSLADDMASLSRLGIQPVVPAVVEGKRLGRAQRESLARAVETHNPRARVPLSGGTIALVDLGSGKIVLKKGG